MQVADTVVVGPGGKPEVATHAAPKTLDKITYVLNVRGLCVVGVGAGWLCFAARAWLMHGSWVAVLRLVHGSFVGWGAGLPCCGSCWLARGVDLGD